MLKEFTECPNCGYKEEEKIRECNKTDCIYYKEDGKPVLHIECTLCEYNQNVLASIDYYKKKQG